MYSTKSFGVLLLIAAIFLTNCKNKNPEFEEFVESFGTIDEYPYYYTDSIANYSPDFDTIKVDYINKYIVGNTGKVNDRAILTNSIKCYANYERYDKETDSYIEIYRNFRIYPKAKFYALIFSVWQFNSLQPYNYCYLATFKKTGELIDMELISEIFHVPNGWTPINCYSKIVFKPDQTIEVKNIENSWSRSEPVIYPDVEKTEKFSINDSGVISH